MVACGPSQCLEEEAKGKCTIKDGQKPQRRHNSPINYIETHTKLDRKHTHESTTIPEAA